MFNPRVLYENARIPQTESQPPFYLGGSNIPSALGFTQVSQGAGISIQEPTRSLKRQQTYDKIILPKVSKRKY